MAEEFIFKRYEAFEIDCIANDETGELGSGSFGVVRLGRHKKLGNVALKCFPISGGHREKKRLEKKIQQEFEVLQKANHDNILRMFGWSKWSEAMALITEYMRGGNLRDLLLDDIEISPKLSLRTASELSTGLAFIHNLTKEKRVTHGDMKPENVLLTYDLHCKIGDFGSARFSSYTGSSTATRSKQSMEFTLVYAAPERLQHGTARVKKEQDVYSYALILHMLLTRGMPYEADVESFLAAICRGERPETWKIDNLKKQCEPDDLIIIELLEQVMRECWEHDPELRPDMLSVRDGLQDRLLQVDPAEIQHSVNVAVKEMELPPISWEDETKILLTEYSVINRSFRQGSGGNIPQHFVPDFPAVVEDPPVPVPESSVSVTQPQDASVIVPQAQEAPDNEPPSENAESIQTPFENAESSETNPKLLVDSLNEPEEALTEIDATNPKLLADSLNEPDEALTEIDATNPKLLVDSLNEPDEALTEIDATNPKQVVGIASPSGSLIPSEDETTALKPLASLLNSGNVINVSNEDLTVNDETLPKQVLLDDDITQEEGYHSQVAYNSPAGTVPKQIFTSDQDVPQSHDASLSSEWQISETQPKEANSGPSLTFTSNETEPKKVYEITANSTAQLAPQKGFDAMSLVETVPKKILPMETTNYLYKGKLESGFQTNSVNTKNDGTPPKQVLADNGYTQEESYNSQAAFKSFAETVPKQMFSADQDIPESIDVPPEKFNSYSGSSVDTDFSAPEITQPKKVADESLNTEEEPHNVQVNAFATDVLSLLATENLFSLCITPVDSKPQSGTSPLVPLPRSRSCTNRETTPKQLVMRQTSMQPTRSPDETRMIQPTQFKPQLGASPTIPKIPDDSTVQSTEELTDQPVPDDHDTNSLDSEHPTLSSDDNQIEANLGICLLELRTLEKRIAERDDEVALTFSRSLKFDSLTVANYPQVVEEVISLVTTCISQSMPATAINLICHIIKMISVFRPNDKLVKLELCAKLTMHVHKGGKLEVRTRAMEVLNAIVRVVRRVKEASSRLQSLTEAYCLCCIGQCYYTKRENETAMHHYIASMEILNENLGIEALTAQQIRLHYHIALVYERIGKLRQAHGELDIAKAALQNCTEVDEKVKKELMADIELRIVNCNNVTPDCSVHQLISSIHSAMHVGRHLEVTVKCRRLANLLQSEPIRNLKMLTKNLILTASKLAKAGRIHDAIQIFSQILSLLEVEADPSTRFENLAQLILQIRHVSDMAWLHGKKPFLSQLLNIINEVTGFADSSNATKSLLPKCVDYLSICYFYNGDYDKTVEMSTKAEETSESTSGQSYQFSGWCHYNKGLANFMMKKYKNAILNFVQAHSCFDLLGTQSWARKMALNSNTWINHLNTLAIGEL